MLTNQKVFDNALFGVRGQGYKQSRRRLTDGLLGPCLYRGPDGLKCGIGHSIEDDALAREMDTGDVGGCGGQSIRACLLDSRVFAIFGGVDKSLLKDLQDAHDSCDSSPHKFEASMADVASAFGLSYTAPTA